MARKEGPLKVFFTHAARAEFVAIWHWNASEYGERRADGYIEFLEKEIDKIARSPGIGVAVPEYPGLRRYLAKRQARSHGHIVFYRAVERRLEIIHIYHTAQDWQRRLESEQD